MPTERTALPLAQLGCSGAERLTIERILHDEAGVVEVFVNPVTEMAYVEYEPSVTGPNALFGALRRAGFAPPDREVVRRPRADAGRGGWKW